MASFQAVFYYPSSAQKFSIDINQQDNDGKTALMGAVFDNQIEKTKELIKLGAKVNLKDKTGWTALTYAALNDNLEIIKELIAAGAKINNTVSPLFFSSIKTTDFFLKKEANIDTQDRCGRTALIYAVQNNDIEKVKILLLDKPNLNIKDNTGDTALKYAVFHENKEIVELLLKYEAEINENDKTWIKDLKNNDIKIALDLAIKKRAKMDKKINEIVKQISDVGINTKKENIEKSTALEGKIDSLESKIKSDLATKNEINNLENNLKNITDKNNVLESKIDTFENQVKLDLVTKSEINDLGNNLKDLTDTYTVLEKKLEKSDSAIKNEIKDLGNNLKEITNSYSVLEEKTLKFDLTIKNEIDALGNNLNMLIDKKAALSIENEIEELGKNLQEIIKAFYLTAKNEIDALGNNLKMLIDKKADLNIEKEIEKVRKNLEEIKNRNTELQTKIEQIENFDLNIKNEINEITKKLEVLYKIYQKKQRILEEQKKLYANEAVKTFYITIQALFEAKLISMLLLAGDLLQRTETKKETTATIAGEIASGAVEGIPFIGGLLSSIVNLSIQTGVAKKVDYDKEKQSKKIQYYTINIPNASEFSELIARKIAQKYEELIKFKRLESKTCQEAGKKAVNWIFEDLVNGKIIFKGSTKKDYVQAFIEIIVNKRFDNKNNDVLFKLKSETQESPSKALNKQVAILNDNYKELSEKVEVQKKINKKIKINSFDPSMLELFNRKIEFSFPVSEKSLEPLFKISIDKKYLYIKSLKETKIEKLNKLSEYLYLFDKVKVITDWEIEDQSSIKTDKVLKIEAISTQTAKKMLEFFQKSNLRVIIPQ